MLNIKSRVKRSVMLRQLIFLCVPTAVLMFLLLRAFSEYFPVFNTHVHIKQTIYFALGLFISCFFHSFRFRFLPAFASVLLFFWVIAIGFDYLATGEFDSFFMSIELMIFRTLFLGGWLCGWGYSRFRFFPALLSSIILLLSLMMISKLVEVTFTELVISFFPLLLFSFYIIYIAELIRNSADQHGNNWKFWKALVGAVCVMTVLILGSIWVFRNDFKQLESEWTARNAEGEDPYGMFKKTEDGGQKLKDKLSVDEKTNRGSQGDGKGQGDGGQGKTNNPVYVVYLDNFFPNSNTPNPLYFVASYLTKFDDFTETFEADAEVPYNDLFSPNPSEIPLYFSAHDSLVLVNGMSDTYRKVVETEVYKIRASAEEFIAPTTAFFCQPIAVKPELKDQFTSAYRAKMWVSELNSAYLVYNNTKRDFKLQAFQEQRFEELRTVKNFDEVPKQFVDYYTQFPANVAYDTLKSLARLIVAQADADTPMDQILAIRDFYMEKDEQGKSLFQYTDTPGPIPAGSRLLNFVLNDRKGYCAHFAGSTLFLLRAIGIPSRLAVGYAVVDRSTNNKGWYWLYEKQAHAWVQVFFPKYGWLDFDTTFGDEEREEAPTTDGTPPLEPQKAWFAGTGKVESIDTIAKIMILNMQKMMYHDLEYKFDDGQKIRLDLTLAKIKRDSMQVGIGQIVKGDQALNISFSEPNDMPTVANPQDIQMILTHFPDPVPIDQVIIDTEKVKDEVKKNEENEKASIGLGWETAFIMVISIVLFLLILIFTAPYIIYRIYRHKAKRIKNAQTEAYYPYRASVFLLHQMGVYRTDQTPLQYARLIDQNMGTSFEAFTAVYLKAKYAGQNLNADELERVFTFYRAFEQLVRGKIPFKKRMFHFLNIYNTLDYFSKE